MLYHIILHYIILYLGGTGRSEQAATTQHTDNKTHKHINTYMYIYIYIYMYICNKSIHK